MNSKPDVSIVMPNYNSPVVDQTIEAILNQSFRRNIEIIVVGKDDPNFIKPNPKITFIRTKERTFPSKARNIGIARARAETIVFVDSDCVPEKGWLQAILQNKEDIVTGAVEFDAPSFWTTCDNFVHFYASSRKVKRGEIPLFGTIQLKIPKSKVLSVSGFDENLETGEDLDMAIKLKKAGEKFYFEPNAVVRHYPLRKNLFAVLRHSMYWASNSMAVRIKHKVFLKLPFWLQNRWLLLAVAPFASIAVTANVYSKIYNWKYIYLLPIVLLAKLAWFYGAFRGLKNA